MPNSNDRLALISYLAQSVQEKSTLGKKALQKLVHLASDIADVPSGYNFQLYTYGPFSRELAGDVDILDSMDAITVKFNSARNGYEIETDSNAAKVIEKSKSFIDENRQAIDSIVERFGDRLAKDLELSSMLTFILKNKMVDDLSDDNAVVEKFLEIKPKYPKTEVRKGLIEIRALLN